MTDAARRKAEIRLQFNAVAADCDCGPGAFSHFGRRLVDAAAIGAGDRVLDAASGLGAERHRHASRA